MRSLMFAICTLVALAGPARAGRGVAVGDPAPALSYDEWIKGERVTGFDRGTAYLLEFWGTWCAPCVENIPRLSRLQRQYRKDGLVVVGVASHEFKGREALAVFMRERGARLAYRVAFDADQSMERDWDTGGREGQQFRMPLCFVVDRNGRIAFVGHPGNAALDSVLAALLAHGASARPPGARR